MSCVELCPEALASSELHQSPKRAASSLDPPTTPRMRRRRLMRRFNLLSMLVVLLVTTFLLFAYMGHSYSRREGQGPRVRKAHPPRIQKHPQVIEMDADNEDNVLQAAPVKSQETEHFLLEMARRVEAVKNVCRVDSGDVTHKTLMTHIAADKKEQFLYCVVPHPPSDARLAYQLQRGELWSPQLDAQGGMIRNPYPPPQDFKPGQEEDLYLTRFLVTRHPLQRLLECYTNKFESGKDAKYYKLYGKTMVTNFRERSRDMTDIEVAQLLSKVDDDAEREQTLGNLYANPKGPTFTEFVQYIVNSTQPDDVLWRPIHEHCAPCHIQYNYILSFDDLDAEGDQLMTVLQASLSAKQKNDGAVVGPPSEEASCSYFSQLSNELMLRLIRKYDLELRMFNYSKDSYMKCADEYVRQ